MYFPVLENMSEYQVEDYVISKLDSWLGTRRPAIRKFLNPLHFAIDTGIDEQASLNLFAICTRPEFKVLELRCECECPQCDDILGSFKSYEVPSSIFCEACEQEIDVDLERIVFWFSLIKQPQAQPKPYIKYNTETEMISSGKHSGLQQKDFQESAYPLVRGLMDNWNQRQGSV